MPLSKTTNCSYIIVLFHNDGRENWLQALGESVVKWNIMMSCDSYVKGKQKLRIHWKSNIHCVLKHHECFLIIREQNHWWCSSAGWTWRWWESRGSSWSSRWHSKSHLTFFSVSIHFVCYKDAEIKTSTTHQYIHMCCVLLGSSGW